MMKKRQRLGAMMARLGRLHILDAQIDAANKRVQEAAALGPCLRAFGSMLVAIARYEIEAFGMRRELEAETERIRKMYAPTVNR